MTQTSSEEDGYSQNITMSLAQKLCYLQRVHIEQGKPTIKATHTYC